MITIRISPGSIGILSLAMDLFGIERVCPGDWTSPVWARDLTDEDVAFAKEFFELCGCEVVEETDPHTLSRVNGFNVSNLREMSGLAG